MTPATAPVSTPTRSTADGRAEVVVLAQPVTIVVSAAAAFAAVAAKPTEASFCVSAQAPASTSEVPSAHFATSNWPNFKADKPNPGVDDWRALQGRAFSLRLRGPHGQIGA